MPLSDYVWPLALSTMAGLSTVIGAVIAVLYKPNNDVMAGLLGTAIGVMATVSVVELIIRNAIENDVLLVLAAALLGALAYYLIEPCFPKAEDASSKVLLRLCIPTVTAISPTNSTSTEGSMGYARATSDAGDPMSQRNLLRLGLLMAVTMTAHNLPEGFAVAFSALTSIGPVMAGIIVAAPIYAATGNRWRAVGIATASGLSEPVGALLALLLFYPFVTPARLVFLLSVVGGLMLAVCVLELWPEARNCKNDKGLAYGIAVGTAVMGWTLYMNV